MIQNAVNNMISSVGQLAESRKKALDSMNKRLAEQSGADLSAEPVQQQVQEPVQEPVQQEQPPVQEMIQQTEQVGLHEQRPAKERLKPKRPRAYSRLMERR